MTMDKDIVASLKGWEPKRLNERHQRIKDLYLMGIGRKEIAGELGMSPQAVSMIINSPLFQHSIAGKREELEDEKREIMGGELVRAREVLERASLRAAETHEELLDHEDPRVRQKSADSILDRVGISGRDQVGGVRIEIDSQVMEGLIRALKESRGEVIDAESD